MAKKLPILIQRQRYSSPVEITGGGIHASFGNNLMLWFGTADEAEKIGVYADRRVLVAVLKKILSAIEIPDTPANENGANRVTPAMTNTIEDWEYITPQMVIEKFASSPNLRPMLDDVKKVLGVGAAEERAHDDAAMVADKIPRENIFDGDGNVKRGAKTRVAEIIGVKYAGNYRARVDRVIDKLAA